MGEINMIELTWIAEARKHIGQREIGTSNTSSLIETWQSVLLGTKIKKGHWLYAQPWCGTYVAYCLKTAGIKYPKHWYRALDYLNYGAKLKRPAYGCVAVKTRNGGGHVCFVVGRDQRTNKIVCLGANQSNMVCLALYDEAIFEAFMWYGKTSNPAQGRYDLPKFTGVTAIKVSES